MDFEAIGSRIKARPEDEIPARSRKAAVALVLVPSEISGLDLLMIKRSEAPHDPWSGHMAFPGGRRDPEDTSPVATAIRESREELGLALELSHLLGELPPMVVPKRVTRGEGLWVQCFLFGLDDRPELTANEEVESVHFFGLDRLLGQEGRDLFDYPFQDGEIQLPCLRLDGCFVWGLSLRMIDDMLEQLAD
jgi:8-oxo-dGTP pyrophosphatase MutT (NUDIX family)